MHGATIHIRLFGLVYDNPKQGDIPCGIDVRIHIVPAIRALERFAVSYTKVMAMAASLRSICRFDDNQPNTRKSTFVREERTELTEIPSAESASESLVPTLGGLTYLAKVFNRKTNASFLCVGNDLLGDGMVDYRCSGLFSPTKPFQELLATSCAFGLNGATDFESLSPILVQSVGGVDSAFGCTDNVRNAEIKTYEVVRILGFGFGNIDGLIEEEIAFLKCKVRFSLDVRNIFFVVADKRNLLTFPDCPDGNFGFLVGQDSGIVADASVGPELTLLLVVKLVRIGNLADTANNHLSGEVESLTNIVITKMVDFELTEGLVRPSNVGDIGTRLVGFFHRLEKKRPLLIAGENLYFQDQFHIANVLKVFCLTTFLITKKRDAAQFRPLS